MKHIGIFYPQYFTVPFDKGKNARQWEKIHRTLKYKKKITSLVLFSSNESFYHRLETLASIHTIYTIYDTIEM